MIDLIFCSLLTWRISSLLVRERGPYAVLERLREAAGVHIETDFQTDANGALIKIEQQKADTELGQLFLCLWCCSLWVGLVVAKGNILNALTFSAGAILINSYVDKTS